MAREALAVRAGELTTQVTRRTVGRRMRSGERKDGVVIEIGTACEGRPIPGSGLVTLLTVSREPCFLMIRPLRLLVVLKMTLIALCWCRCEVERGFAAVTRRTVDSTVCSCQRKQRGAVSV